MRIGIKKLEADEIMHESVMSVSCVDFINEWVNLTERFVDSLNHNLANSSLVTCYY